MGMIVMLGLALVMLPGGRMPAGSDLGNGAMAVILQYFLVIVALEGIRNGAGWNWQTEDRIPMGNQEV